MKNSDNDTQIRENEIQMNNSNFIEISKDKTFATNNSPKVTQNSPNHGVFTENMLKFSLQLLQSE